MAKFKNHNGEIIDTTLQVTTTSSGIMSKDDKVKLNGIESGANNYTHPTTHLASIITEDTTRRFVTDSEKAAWNAKASSAVATTSANGLMSSADKTKLDGITAGATKITVDSALNTTSTNPVQNKIVNAAITVKANSTDLTTHTSNKSNPHGVTLAQVGAAAASHNHSADNITSGTLSVARGGTGQTTVAGILSSLGLSNYGLICSAATTTASITLPATTIVKVPLNSFKFNTDSSVFSFSGNGVKVNKAGYILASGSIYVVPSEQLNVGAYIYKNTAEVASQYLNTVHSSAISTGAKIISVAAGDIIYLYARSSKAGTCTNEVTTYLDIMYIK